MAVNRIESFRQFSERKELLDAKITCVFISHQQKDKVAARKVASFFLATGIDVYFDEMDKDLRISHQSGDAKKVTEAICKGINNSSHMLVLVSPHSIHSSWIPFEIGYGYDKTDLAVLCLKGIPKGGLPEYIRTVPIIRDLWDLRGKISRLSPIINELKTFSAIHEYNDLSDVMDELIADS